MFLMMAEVIEICRVASQLPNSDMWLILCYHQRHVEWIGCSLHDMIQPSFSFLVGVALPFSLASRFCARAITDFNDASCNLALLVISIPRNLSAIHNTTNTNFTLKTLLVRLDSLYFLVFDCTTINTSTMDCPRRYTRRLLGSLRSLSFAGT